MRILIADDGDTVRKIARQHRIAVTDLMKLNPAVKGPDQLVGGIPIRLPAMDTAADISRMYIPLSCPPVPPIDYLDQWIPLTPIEEMEQTEYDVLIVGTGAGGSAVLWRLCEQLKLTGKRIGIVEAGGLLLPMHVQNLPTMNVKRFTQFFTNPKISIPIGRRIPDFPAATLLHALGGRMLFWSGVSPRMHPSVLRTWPVSLKEMSVYYNIAEEVMHVSRAYTEGSSITEVVVNRLRGGGFTEAAGFPIATDVTPTRFGQIRSNVFYSSMNLLGTSLNLRPFDLAVNAHAVKVFRENGKAIGVEVKDPNKKSFFIRSKHVVLSAGALNTPQILLHSEIPGTAIGHYLTNHSFLMAHGVLDRTEFPELLGTLGVLIPQTDEQPYQIQLYGPGDHFWYSYQEPPLQKELGVRYEGFGIVESRFQNRMYVDPNFRDEYGVPAIQIDFSYSDRDREIMDLVAQGIRRAAAIIKAPLVSRNGRDDLCLTPAGQDNHVSGTCRMSTNSRYGVTNPYGEVFGVAGLFVADNSVLPPIGASNPTLTTVALAIRTADYIAAKLMDRN